MLLALVYADEVGRRQTVALDRASVFATLARSESRQTAQAKSLLSRYRVRDPVAGMPEGRFADPTFERLYRSYVRQGGWSRWDARSAAMLMEKGGIRAFRARLLSAASPDLRRLLTQLQRVSTSHVHMLEHWGEGLGWLRWRQLRPPGSLDGRLIPASPRRARRGTPGR